MLRSKGDSGLFFSSGFSGESRVLSTGPCGCAGDDGSFFFFCGLMMLPRFFFLIWGFSEEELILITSGFLGGSAI